MPIDFIKQPCSISLAFQVNFSHRQSEYFSRCIVLRLINNGDTPMSGIIDLIIKKNFPLKNIQISMFLVPLRRPTGIHSSTVFIIEIIPLNLFIPSIQRTKCISRRTFAFSFNTNVNAFIQLDCVMEFIIKTQILPRRIV